MNQTGFIVILLSVTVPFGLMYIVYWIRGRLLKRAAVAEVRPVPGRPFDIRFGAEAGIRYRVLMEMKVVYEDAEDHFGVYADYALEVSGKTLVREAAGTGRELPPGVREITRQTFTDLTAIGGQTTYRCTVRLAETELCSAGDEIVLTGTVSAVEGTRIRKLRILVVR